jgi:isocitrate dehydrogenase
LDNNRDLADFCTTLEEVCIQTVEGGQMTKDLAMLIHKEEMTRKDYLSTQDFLAAIKENLDKALVA